MEIKIKKLRETAKLPTHGSNNAAGYDLYANIEEPVFIRPHDTVKIGTGLAMEIPQGYYGAIMARSGLSFKYGLRPANCVGICDSDYRGEYIIALHNDFDYPQLIYPDQRIAQLLILPCQTADFVEVEELEDTSRGEGGFGSTGQ